METEALMMMMMMMEPNEACAKELLAAAIENGPSEFRLKITCILAWTPRAAIAAIFSQGT